MGTLRWVLILTLAPLACGSQMLPVADKAEVVRDFVAAFNAHDPAAMATFVADDIKWLSVDDGSVSVEVEGRAALVAAMSEYFTSCPTCRSEIHDLIASSERVSVVEVAGWGVGDERKSQRAMAVYEFTDSLIQGVYYFPAEREAIQSDGAQP